MDEDNQRKAIIYGGNFVAPSVINMLKELPRLPEVGINVLDAVGNAAHPYGAAIYGGLSLLKGLSDKVQNRFSRLAEFGGAAYFGILTASDLLAFGNGDYGALANLVFDGSMALQLGIDTKQNYEGEDLWDDLTDWE